MAQRPKETQQPNLFENQRGEARQLDDRQLLLYALGEFQARGKALAERDLPLDRLRGAIKRAAETFGEEEINDERAVAAFTALGAHTKRVPTFVAKHPYRITVPLPLAEQALAVYRQLSQSAATTTTGANGDA
jgi:hypothetical protein